MKTTTSSSIPPRRGSQVIVIHPGSRFLRIGRASDVIPLSIPCVVARKCRTGMPEVTHIRNVARPWSQMTQDEITQQKETTEEANNKDPFDAKLASMIGSLKERMRFFKIRTVYNAFTISTTFNKQFQPEIISEQNDPMQIDWIDHTSTEDVLVGDTALRIGDPQNAGYIVRYPIYNRNFNLRDYPSVRVVLSDLEALVLWGLQEKCGLQRRDLKDYSVVLVIPDLYDRAYVCDFLNLLISMGFKRFCAQQESLAATYGAGVSNACVVDIGATTTSIACIEEGMVIPDTRMRLGVGGDDITEFLSVLLKRIYLPYKEMDLVRSYDWNIMEDLKAKMCTLTESDVATNLCGFQVRRPNQPTVKYGFRVYDEVILAPMCLFEPRVIQFDAKRPTRRNTPNSMVTDEIVEQTSDIITNAMIISTRHLMPGTTTEESTTKSKLTTQASGTSTPGKVEAETTTSTTGVSRSTSQTPTEVQAEANSQTSQPSETTPPAAPAQVPVYAGGYNIDVPFEASMLPLDVAIFNSVRAAGEDRIRKYLQMVLLVGGSTQISGIAPALESRLQAIATPVVSGMEKVQVIPPPKDVSPQILAWKGAAVLGKMESISELWVTPSDWEILGIRGLKERCFFL